MLPGLLEHQGSNCKLRWFDMVQASWCGKPLQAVPWLHRPNSVRGSGDSNTPGGMKMWFNLILIFLATKRLWGWIRTRPWTSIVWPAGIALLNKNKKHYCRTLSSSLPGVCDCARSNQMKTKRTCIVHVEYLGQWAHIWICMHIYWLKGRLVYNT